MDQSTLVTSGQTLVRALDASGFAPRLAIWVALYRHRHLEALARSADRQER